MSGCLIKPQIMRKELLITNYYPSKLKLARESSGLSLTDVEAILDLPVDELELFETEDPITPVDIFLLGTLFNTYEESAKKNGTEFKLSLTLDILYNHPKGIEYQEFIINSANFSGFPVKRNANGNISWIATIDSSQGIERMEFWNKKMRAFGLKANDVIEAGMRQKVAFLNHPTKQHVCLFTGNSLYIDYRYPAPGRIDILNRKYDETFKYYDLDINELAKILYKIDGCNLFKEVFGLNRALTSLEEILANINTDLILAERRGYTSPGVMSNSPDRLDGYHTYNSDVRDVIDTGRRKENLKRYTQDRRVYENWADGDWKQADRLYAEFKKHGVSPDHIGPMSLGFCHRPKFQPMTASANSSKGNRMTFGDVKILLADELAGECVISWHSKPIWDRLKSKVANDTDALKLSSLMRKNLHHVLIIFSIIYEEGCQRFLEQFLNPQYSYFDYEFDGFDPKSGTFKSMKQYELNGRNQKNNAERYHRIAFEELKEYVNIDNRNSKIWDSKDINIEIKSLLFLLASKKEDEAKIKLLEIFDFMAKLAEDQW